MFKEMSKMRTPDGKCVLIRMCSYLAFYLDTMRARVHRTCGGLTR